MTKKKDPFIFPVSVEETALVLKCLCDDYRSGNLNRMEFEQSLRDIHFMRNKLFISALTKRWIGQKRVELILTLIGPLQTCCFRG